MVYIYILELESKKYYVGKTNNPSDRLSQHFSEIKKPEWVKKYPLKEIKEVIPDCDDFDEDKFTIMAMSLYGIENVRGGSFTKVELESDVTKVLCQMIRGCTDKCLKCGRGTHFAKNCKNKTEVKDIVVTKIKKVRKKKTCSRCGRTGHTKTKCFAKTTLDGRELSK